MRQVAYEAFLKTRANLKYILSFLSERGDISLMRFRKKRENIKYILSFCRKEATRTPDPYVPNVVRYQLRYFPILVVQR